MTDWDIAVTIFIVGFIALTALAGYALKLLHDYTSYGSSQRLLRDASLVAAGIAPNAALSSLPVETSHVPPKVPGTVTVATMPARREPKKLNVSPNVQSGNKFKVLDPID